MTVLAGLRYWFLKSSRLFKSTDFNEIRLSPQCCLCNITSPESRKEIHALNFYNFRSSQWINVILAFIHYMPYMLLLRYSAYHWIRQYETYKSVKNSLWLDIACFFTFKCEGTLPFRIIQYGTSISNKIWWLCQIFVFKSLMQ